MLKSWFIENFKPILHSGDLPLAPVTVLAGRNSSGKSSLIQSILMIAQTLSNRILDRALLPNGPIVQLGTFEDILSEQTNLRTMVVGFELEFEKEGMQALLGKRWAAVRSALGFIEDIKSIKITSQFRSASSNGTSASAIEASKVNVEHVSVEVIGAPVSLKEDASESQFNFEVDIQRLTSVELDEFLADVSPDYYRLLPYTKKSANYLGTFALKSEIASIQAIGPCLVSFSHFLPARLIGKYLIKERLKSGLMRALDLAFKYPDEDVDLFKRFFKHFDLGFEFPDGLRRALLDLCESEGISETFSGQTLNDLIIWYKVLKINKEDEGVQNKFEEVIAQSILDQLPQSEKGIRALEDLTNNIHVQYLERAMEQTIQFFTSRIRYLGPLRADPQTAQKFAPSSELDDVGAKGEYAAAVYDANQNAAIQWYDPFKEQVENSTLKVALDTWLRYLGVANEVKIQMAGQSGVSWHVVHRKGHKPLPLTAVGVGVSQILPILVMGLLAPNNTLLLVEQPELHLHPSVQARLGDFFMGLAQCGKQCLIETHSENLVSQLRYHIVQAGGQKDSNCLIYFVDQDEQGAARFNPIEISAQGNILNWPDGFFDETMLQEDRITAAGLKKRAKKQGRNDEYSD